MSLIDSLVDYRKDNEYVGWAIKCTEWYKINHLTYEKLCVSSASLGMLHYAYIKLVYRKEIVPIEQSEERESIDDICQQYASHLPDRLRRYYKEALWVIANLISIV